VELWSRRLNEAGGVESCKEKMMDKSWKLLRKKELARVLSRRYAICYMLYAICYMLYAI
jgi:hypothetical protein